MKNRNSKNYLLLITFLLVVICSSCSDTSVDENMSGNIGDAWTFGIPNAPTLHESFGIESGGRFLSWSIIKGTEYYELEESNNSSFSWITNTFKLGGTSYSPSGTSSKYYRVRAVRGNKATAWSNILTYSF
ncbi:MAG: hypothetical protein WCZ90_08300 [Melioribacteraceae bacterium]